MKYLVNGDIVEFDPNPVDLVRLTAGTDRVFVHTDEGTFSAVQVRVGDKTYVSFRGRQYVVQLQGQGHQPELASGGGELRAPMPGIIVDVRAKVGDSVKRGQVLLVLEAMKTQLPVVAQIDGLVSNIVEIAGSVVSEGQLLAIVTSYTDK